jgi:hypothetical protein
MTWPFVGNQTEVGGLDLRGMAVPMFERIAGKADLTRSAAYALLQSQEPLPPYELDPAFDSPAVRKRIGDVIAKATREANSQTSQSGR